MFFPSCWMVFSLVLDGTAGIKKRLDNNRHAENTRQRRAIHVTDDERPPMVLGLFLTESGFLF